MKEKYLPLGTVVTLQNATKKIMIIGYCPVTDDNKVYDYVACTYPEGIISSDQTLVFNHNQIAIINNMGQETEEYQNFNNQIKNAVEKINEVKNIDFSGE